VTNWTLIITTLGASGISATSAYWIAKRGSDATARQVEAETTRAREQIEAENERLREQHREDHLRNRQGTYHQFLAGEYRYMAAFRDAAAGARPTRDEIDKWWPDFVTLALGVELFGAPTVHEVGAVLLKAWFGASLALDAELRNGVAFAEAARRAYEANEQAINTARAALVREMRRDVAPADE
jgi:hypothetical protein